MLIPIIYPYKMGSQSAKKLVHSLQDLGCKRVYPDKKYKPESNHLVIGWGAKTIPIWYDLPICYTALNMPAFTPQNKLYFFNMTYNPGDPITPDWTTTPDTADNWLSEGHTVVVRHVLNGHGGLGVQLVKPGEELPGAPLYVQYKKKKHEYRIHVWGDEVLDIQMKRKKQSIPNDDVNYQVRNHNNGWVFCRDNIIEPDDKVIDVALKAVDRCGLDFGAVDVIWNEHEQKAYALEANTAPGLEGTTLDIYSNKIRSLCNEA